MHSGSPHHFWCLLANLCVICMVPMSQVGTLTCVLKMEPSLALFTPLSKRDWVLTGTCLDGVCPQQHHSSSCYWEMSGNLSEERGSEQVQCTLWVASFSQSSFGTELTFIFSGKSHLSEDGWYTHPLHENRLVAGAHWLFSVANTAMAKDMGGGGQVFMSELLHTELGCSK